MLRLFFLFSAVAFFRIRVENLAVMKSQTKSLQIISLHAILFCMSVVLCGCGGDKTSTPPPEAAATAPLPPAQPVAKPAAKPAAKPDKPSTQARKRETERTEPITSNDFAVQKEGKNFGALAYSDVSSRDKFVAVIPPADYDATRFTVSLPKELANTKQPKTAKVTLTLELPETFQPLLQFGINQNGQPNRIEHTLTGYQLQLIPGGVFTMGTNDGPEDCKPEHTVHLTDYYIGVTEVTLGQYETYLLEAKKLKGPQPTAASNKGDSPEVPAVGISWRDALNFANLYGMALPTEAQWEKAARGEQGYRYPWGNDRPLWEKPRRFGQITPIQSYQNDVSPYGIFDVAGNAREWTNDWYSSKAYEKTTESDGSPLRNPLGPNRAEITSHRVIKGGNNGWQLWHRSSATMKDGSQDVGFRCVFNIVEKAN